MYKHILVAIDDSQTSRKALDEAVTLARLHAAKLEIVHAVDELLVQAFTNHGVELSSARQLEKAMMASGEALLDEAVETARAQGLTASRRLLAEADVNTSDQITEAAERSGADLLIVGSHGRRGFRRLLLGSVAENLLRKVNVSVLIVRGHTEP